MVPTPNGSGEEPEKYPDPAAPPTVFITNPTGVDVPDAGLKGLDHYKRKLPPWRYNLRTKLLPIIRWETPYLAWLQDRVRSPALDSYFAITANLGTHTFFMIVLPILFWCGSSSLGFAMVRILASGIFFTGFVKDLLSLPRPLSPPLYRITMSGSAALEYGFPSSHSANAVSVVVYALLSFRSPECSLQPSTKLVLESMSYFYALSITLGRLYCGMHGFFDVVFGSFMGVFIGVLEAAYGPAFDSWIHTSSWHAPFAVALIIIGLVYLHPEPADNCPCIDDSIAFAGVVIGIVIGGWHYATSGWGWDFPVPATVPFDLQHLGWTVVILRVLFGVMTIFAWREVMKPTLLKLLPHIFRAIDKVGLNLPRRFFKPASEYQKIPSRLKVDNVMPSVSDLPSLLTSIRHPGRGRSVSVGPQSAADAYETLAYRDKRRRESISSNGATSPIIRATSDKKDAGEYFSITRGNADDLSHSELSGISTTLKMNGNGNITTPIQSRVGTYEQMMGQGQVVLSPPSTGPGSPVLGAKDESDILLGQENDLGEKEMFLRLEKPRVRYDVEVVTKLIVYAGIAWLAIEANPVLFELIGLVTRLCHNLVYVCLVACWVQGPEKCSETFRTAFW